MQDSNKKFEEALKAAETIYKQGNWRRTIEIATIAITEIEKDQKEKENIKNKIAQIKENANAELLIIEAEKINKTNFVDMHNLLSSAYDKVQKKTIIAGHIDKYLAICWITAFKEETEKDEKNLFLVRSITYLKRALEDYPIDQTGYRDEIQSMLDKLPAEE